MGDATFDDVNLIIRLPSGQNLVDVKTNIYTPWKEHRLAGLDNRRAPPAFRTIGGDALTPGIDAGAYFFLQNDAGWRIQPAEEDATVNFTGNLAPEDSALAMTKPTDGPFTVLLNGLQPITQSVENILLQQQLAEYGGVVAIDTINGVPGTVYPIGTKSTPVDNLADAATIAGVNGFRNFTLVGTIVLDRAFTFAKFFGQIGNAVVNINGQDVSGTTFERCAVFGDFSAITAAAPAALFRCFLPAPVTDFVGNLGECLFTSSVSLQAGLTSVIRCNSNVPGMNKPTINFQGNAVDLSCRVFTGGLELQNITDPSSDVSVDLSGGRLELASTVTEGEVVVGGVGTLVKGQGPNVNLNTDSLIDGLDVKLIKALDAGNVAITGSNPFVVEVLDPDDDVTVIARFDVSADGKTRTRTL